MIPNRSQKDPERGFASTGAIWKEGKGGGEEEGVVPTLPLNKSPSVASANLHNSAAGGGA